MVNVNDSIMEMVESLMSFAKETKSFIKEASVENGEKIIREVDICDEKFVQVKQDLIKLIESKNEEHIVTGIATNNGFLISNKGGNDE